MLSDHDCAVAEPLAGAGLNLFAGWLHSVRWEGELTLDLQPTEMALKMEEMCRRQVKLVFPTKSVRVSSQDKPFITCELKKLDKYAKREYRLRGKTEKYVKLKSVYDTKFKKASSEFLRGCITDMMEEAPGKAYRAMKKLGARPGDTDMDTGFFLTSHVESNLSPKQSVERLAEYFSTISQQYTALDMNSLPIRVREKLDAPVNSCDIPKIEVFEVWEMMKKGKKTKSSVPGELPARLRHEFGPELAEPAAIIFNQIASTGEWPEHWKEGSAVPLKKVNQPKDESETRLIEITHYLSLLMEHFVLQWLLRFISDKLDRDQFGGSKGHSVAHYLIEVMNFVLYNQDLSEPVSTILTAIDIHKGFNKVDHTTTITCLSDMNTPGWLLRIIYKYLSNRSFSVRYRNETSTAKQMPGGLAAGTILGLNCFLILFNGAGPASNPVGIGRLISQPMTKRKPMKKGKVKWVDDATIATALDLKKSLVPEDRPVPRPVPYHGRTEHRLPLHLNTMQSELDELTRFTSSQLMSINQKKTQAMLCNTRVKWDFIPELYLDNNQIEIVDEIKIVGYIMRSDMKTSSNTAYLVAKAFKRMWLIRRLKLLGASTVQLLDTLQKQVLSVLWLGAPAWFCQLTEHEKNDLDRVAKVALKIIYGDMYCGFENTLKLANIVKPTTQLLKMTKKFANRSAKHPKFSQWFQPVPEDMVSTRSKKNTFVQIPTRTDRYYKSPIPYLTRLLNEDSK